MVAMIAPCVLAQPQPGWTLFTRMNQTETTLIDLSGTTVHTWASAYSPGNSVYLLDDGAILRTTKDASLPGPAGGGTGGRLQIIAWDGTLIWDHAVATNDYKHHHDVALLPNGNVLALIWERKTIADAIAVGRDPNRINGEFWSEGVLEIKPTGPTTGDIVWEWHAWDHLVQDFDSTKPDFGDPADSPERIDVNYPPNGVGPDWLHLNAIDYNAELDQIMLSSNFVEELWIISHEPGASGELLYRWGNPAAYNMGGFGDQKLWGQHDPQWIEPGLPGAGNILIYNNGRDRPEGAYSSLDELTPPLNPDGTYARTPGQPYGPTSLAWTCDNADGATFYSSFISGVQRLPNGNTLACVGAEGDFVEVNSASQVQWSFAVTPLVFRTTRIPDRDKRLHGLLWCLADVTTQGAGVGDPEHRVPDQLVTGTDISLFVNDWIAGDSVYADVTTTGAGAGDPGYLVPDGEVTGADLQLFVNVWVDGCP